MSQVITGTHLKERTKLLLLLLATILSSFAWFFVTSSPAFACTPPNTICAGDEDQYVGPEAPVEVRPAKPASAGSYTYRAFDANNYNFTVGCSTWNGASTWQLSSNCDVTPEKVKGSATVGEQNGSGSAYILDALTTSGRPVYSMASQSAATTYVDQNRTCAPSGEKSSYAQTWNKKSVQTIRNQLDFVWVQRGTRPTEGRWVSVVLQDVQVGETVAYYFVGCVNPINAQSSVKCFWNYGGNAYYTINRTQASAGWSDFGPRPSLGSDPRTPSGGSGTTPPNCDRTQTVSITYNKAVDKLGYYRIYVDYNYRTYDNLRWTTHSGNVLYSRWTQGATLAGSSTTWWAYSCSAGLPNATEGAYYSQGALPDRDSSLNPANCPQSVWECQLSSPQTIGLDQAGLVSGSTNPTTPVTVMRNGEKIPVTFAKVRIVDQTNGTSTDVTNGTIGGGVKDITSIEYKAEVKEGSSPFYGTDPNDTKQYFKLFRDSHPNSNSTDRWGTWYSNANTNINKNLTFVWASEGGKPFVAERTYRVTGSFLVPQGGNIGSGSSAGAPQGSEWKVGTYDCLDYDYSSGTRISNGPLAASSNDVNVVRSVTNAG